MAPDQPQAAIYNTQLSKALWSTTKVLAYTTCSTGLSSTWESLSNTSSFLVRKGCASRQKVFLCRLITFNHVQRLHM